MNKKLISLILAIGAVFAFSACTADESSRASDEAVSKTILGDLQKAHPVPKFAYSQYRQNLVEIVTAQAESTPTTSFFFNQGVTDPIKTCSSVGFPIPSTAQLTNPEQVVDRYEGDVTIPQVEPNGVYTGESTATYVICRDAQGRAYGEYWEGNVLTETGPAEWDYDKKAIVSIGAPTGEFTTGE